MSNPRDRFLTPSDKRSRIKTGERTTAASRLPMGSIAVFGFPAKVNPQDIKVFDRKINVINREKFKKRHKDSTNDFIGTLKIF